MNTDALDKRIEAAADEAAALTQAFVRVPTVNPPGDNYADFAELLGTRLRAGGFAVERLRAEGTPGDCDARPRVNLIARREGARPGRTVHFNSHIDVVEPGAGWTRDPFAAVRDGDRIYGRGTCDMKGGLAASILAAEALFAEAPALPGAIEISGTVDEESGGFGGVAWLAERGYFSAPRVDHVIIPEPLGVGRVCVGHRGVWWGEVTTHGRIAHGSMPFLGDSAIRHMAAVLEAFERDLYPALAARRSAMPVVPEGARASTLNYNSLHGGQAEPAGGGLPSPVVADLCRLVLDRRFPSEETGADVVAEIAAVLARLERDRPGFRYGLREMFRVEPSQTDAADPVVAATRAAVEQVTGVAAEVVCSPGSYDQKHIDRIGRLGSCIAYGPGILDLAHQPDEYVEVSAIVASAKVMARAAHTLLTRP